MVELDRVVQEAVEDRARTTVQEVVERILHTDLAVHLGSKRVLDKARGAGKAADELAVDDSRRNERIGIIDVLHYDLVTLRDVVWVCHVTRTCSLTELACRVDRDLEVVGDADVEVASEVVTVECRTGLRTIILDYVCNTFLTEITE